MKTTEVPAADVPPHPAHTHAHLASRYIGLLFHGSICPLPRPFQLRDTENPKGLYSMAGRKHEPVVQYPVLSSFPYSNLIRPIFPPKRGPIQDP